MSLDDLLIILDEARGADDVTIPRGLLEELVAAGAPPDVGLARPEDYEDRSGYDPDFIEGLAAPLPTFDPALASDLVAVGDGSNVLAYEHFGLMISRSRRLARVTAVNIDGGRRLEIERGRDRWSFDPRIGIEFQIGNDLYANNALDRGHLVRRQDPTWGDSLEESQMANDDTFHFTNCSPQHEDFNQNTTTWHGLEDYILNISRESGLLVSVFTGPVLSEDDPEYRGAQLPTRYWKIVATLASDGSPSATAYLLNQIGLLSTLDGLVGPFGPFGVFQTSITAVEAQTSLDFGMLREFDPLATDEAALTVPRRLDDLHDIAI
jgi:endonuclease G, mitochondrial